MKKPGADAPGFLTLPAAIIRRPVIARTIVAIAGAVIRTPVARPIVVRVVVAIWPGSGVCACRECTGSETESDTRTKAAASPPRFGRRSDRRRPEGGNRRQYCKCSFHAG